MENRFKVNGRIENLIGHLKAALVYKHKFASFGSHSLIIRPIQIDSPEAVSIGNNVYIAHYGWIKGGIEGKLSMSIGNGVQIGHFAHIVSRQSITIENNVLIADRVYISDCTHNYEDVSVPVLDQCVKILSPVVIGEGSWIGENVCILGASVGKHCIIGANSVVNKDIPDYCVVAGSPARIIKKYDFETHAWVNI